jgi:hypothetical protein
MSHGLWQRHCHGQRRHSGCLGQFEGPRGSHSVAAIPPTSKVSVSMIQSNTNTLVHTCIYNIIHTHIKVLYFAIFYSSLCSYHDIQIHAHTVRIHWHSDISQIYTYTSRLAFSSIQYNPCHSLPAPLSSHCMFHSNFWTHIHSTA